MLTLAHPWLLLALPLPLLLLRLLPPYRETRPALHVPFLDRLARLSGRQPAPGAAVARRGLVQRALVGLCWCCLAVALARPQWIDEPIVREQPMRDLMLAVDLSGSMETADFTDTAGRRIERLDAVKQVLDDFLSRRDGDRVGLIFFGTAPFLQVPFTEDLGACRALLDEAQVRMCGPQTALGDAIGLALQSFQRSDLDERVLIALTDGNDTSSQLPPQKAAEVARDEGVTVFCVGVGDPTATGEQKFDEEALAGVARITGGEFFHAEDRDQLAAVYRRLDELQQRKVRTISHRPRRDLFQWPLGLVVVLLIAWHARAQAAAARRAAWRPARRPAATALMVPGLAAVATLGDFHFLRPWWLLALLPAALLVYGAHRSRGSAGGWRPWVDPHLLGHLVRGGTGRRRLLQPLHLLACFLPIAILALAGPSWRREPSPFTEDRAAVAIAVKSSESMLAGDVQPSRLERAGHKVTDLLRLRPGARAALVAYSGSAHLVMPLTTDARAIAYFADELSPEIMPRAGDSPAAAVALANRLLVEAGTSGSILLVTDAVPAADVDALAAHRRAGGAPVHLLAVGAEAALDLPALRQAARAGGGSLALVTADSADVAQLAARLETSWTPAGAPGRDGERWRDSGYALTPLLAVLGLLWFRPGWLVRYD